MIVQEKLAAQSAIPQGYFSVQDGKVIEGDMIWDFVGSKYTTVDVPAPFKPGQKRAGRNQITQITQIGQFVHNFIMVVRK